MSGFDTHGEWFALVGAIFVAWLLVVALFAPHIPYKLHARLDCASKQFIYSLHNLTLSAVHHDSCFEMLTNANQFYPAMLDAIARAQRTINMECYIFRPDNTGRKFMLAMMERARRGSS
jgi:cardiolipin synthase A/B